MTKASETQVGGTHYKNMGDFQPWDVLSKWLTPEEYRGYQKGVAIAYLARERSKGGDTDIRKAIHHLQRLEEELDRLEGDHADNAPVVFPPLPEYDPDSVALTGQADGGWIEWAGGECPVPAGTPIEVKLRNGSVYEGLALQDLFTRAHQWRIGLEHDPSPCSIDIIAYRIINPTT